MNLNRQLQMRPLTPALVQRIEQEVAAVTPFVEKLRHELHQHPELSWQEFNTAKTLEQQLSQIPGISISTGIAETGIIAEIKGAKSGPIVALRADMDALPVTESTGASYASKIQGVMHACGHDGHMAVLTGSARVIANLRDELHGTIRLIFQPAEEGGAGGAAMCKAGALVDVEAIFGLHGWPELPIGCIATRPGPIMASTSEIHISISGKGTHAAFPHMGTDQILIGCRLVEALQGIVARECNPVDSVVLSITTFHGGRATNVIPERIELSGTLRTINQNTLNHCSRRIQEIGQAIGIQYGVKVEIGIKHGYPVTVNDEACAQYVSSVGEAVLGKNQVHQVQFPSMGAEDFAYYLLEKPGAYFFLGMDDRAAGAYPPLHHPAYDFNDRALPTGVRIMTHLALRFAKNS